MNVAEQKESGCISTSTGKCFSSLAPEQDAIEIEDIALSLSRIPRFAGKTRDDFPAYSVAQHCVFVSHICLPQDALWGLLHDAAEAYVMDMPAPVKAHIAGYKAREKDIQRHICTRFGLDNVEPESVKAADLVMVMAEQRDLMPHSTWYNRDFKDVAHVPPIVPIEATRARAWFMQRFRQLTQEKGK